MRQSANNTFKDGMNLDLHPIVTPNTVLTDNLNGTFITYNGNEFCLQNDRGNKQVADFPEELTPIGAKEYNGVIYIVSVRDTEGGTETEIGTYPGINWMQDAGDLDYAKYTPLRIMGDKSIRISIESYTPDRTIDLDAEQIYNYAAGMNITVLSVEDYKNLLTNKYIDIPVEASYNTIYRIARDVLENFKNPLSLGEITIKESFYYSGITDFRAIDLGYTTKTPVTIEIQPSYDGSVNLILVTDNIEPRIINSGFSVLPNEKYQILTNKRNQTKQTNIYSSDIDLLKEEIALVRRTNILTNIDLIEVQSGGQWKGGNYTFYIKFGDADYNQTDVVAESGIVSIFNGNDGVPSTISGALADERTDKMICLGIDGLNNVYSKIYIYYTREYSDTNGFRMTESGMLTEPIDMKLDENKSDYQTIWLTGFEATQPISIEELNVDYHTINSARAEAQNANMLFLGNIKQDETFKLYDYLKKQCLEHVLVSQVSTKVTHGGYDYNIEDSEYYSTNNIYYSLGYWPEEVYRFGIVFILKDGSKTPVFNIKGRDLREDRYNNNGELQLSESNNDYGVFITRKESIINEMTINPIGFCFKLDNFNFGEYQNDIIGWFVVRQKRIPNKICQGLSIAVDNKSHTPIIYDGTNWISQSFLSLDREKTEGDELIPRLVYNSIKDGRIVSDEDNWYDWALLNYYKNYYYFNEDSEESVKTITVDEPITMDIRNWPYYRDWITTLLNSNKPDDANDVIIQFNNVKRENQGISDENANAWAVYDKTNITTYWYRLYTNKDEPTNSYIASVLPINISDYDVSDSKTYNADHSEDAKQAYVKYNMTHSITLKLLKEKWSNWKGSDGLISLDPCTVPTIASMLDGSEFLIDKDFDTDIESNNLKTRYIYKIKSAESTLRDIKQKCVFIPANTNMKMIGEYAFSNVAGNASDVSQYKWFTTGFGVRRKDHKYYRDNDIKEGASNADFTDPNNVNILRGLFTPYIGIASYEAFSDVQVGIYTIKQHVLSLDDILVRKQDNSEFYCVSKYLPINITSCNVFRGDCYTNTVTMRIIRNFIDPSVPGGEQIVNEEAWNKYVKLSDKEEEEFEEVNRADVNTVDLGLWVTFKCLSSYNLGLRSIDTFNPEEMALMGSARSFFPLNGASTATGNKLEESFLLNDGLSATVGRKRYNLLPDTPYNKSEFANRIMFSNVNVTDSFTNGYRTFQGLSYQDYDKQYGAITKLISWGTNLFVVMEHGLALVPVNEKALMQTTTGETIHIYGHGVLPDQMTIISQDFGSKYEHSVIRTPIGIYGIDTDARKIWRFSDKNGFETLSDMKIETYLNDNLFTDKEVDIETCDVRAHYDSFKGDVMFTFYNRDKNGE